MNPLIVVKVGGSLFDLVDLGSRLNCYAAALAPSRVLFVPGGGSITDSIRSLDRTHGLSQEQSHWLAMRTLSVSAHFLACLLPGVDVVAKIDSDTRFPAILDPYSFALADEASPARLPRNWDVTSDSIALRVAVVFGAKSLVLAKSLETRENTTWTKASQAGIVDAYFPTLIQSALNLDIQIVNLRAWHYL